MVRVSIRSAIVNIVASVFGFSRVGIVVGLGLWPIQALILGCVVLWYATSG